jgi:predicted alpha/beta-fold hydrolase
MNAFKSTTLFITLILSQIVFAQPYSFPKGTALRTTLAGNLFKAPKNKDIKPETFKVSPLGRKQSLKLKYFPSRSESKRLMIILAGIGGDTKGNLSNSLAYWASENNLHALIVPSVFTKNFLQSTSTSGVAGSMKEDTEDMLVALEKAVQKLIIKKDLRPEEYFLSGYSLGGLTALHLNSTVQREKSFIQFSKTVAINPPIDLVQALSYLDLGLSYKKEVGFPTLSRWYKVAIQGSRKKPSVAHFQKTYNKLKKFSEKEVHFFLARALSDALGDVSKTSQKMLKRTKIEKNKNFESYIRKIVLPYYKERFGLESMDIGLFNSRNSMSALESELLSSDNIYVFHNADDFLISGQKDLDYLNFLFASPQLKVYPRGGHTGNLWFETNKEDLFNLFK